MEKIRRSILMGGGKTLLLGFALLVIALAATGCEQPDKGPVAVDSITISSELQTSDIVFEEGRTFKLTADIQPDNATDKTVVWSSDDENVATVSDDGTVTIKGAGKVIITAEAGNVSDSIQFIFHNEIPVAVDSITISSELQTTDIVFEEGRTFKLTADIQPDNATDKTVVWSSDDENVATVSDDGTVTIKGVGNVTIKAEAGGKSASDTFVFYEEEDLGFYFNETENTYYIWNATGLLAWNAYVTTNGDYSNPGRLKTNAVLLDNITLLDNWTPVGTDTNRYTGTFEGGGHTISNLKINLPNTNDLGLFGGVAETGEVKNLTLSGVEISGSGCTGGIAGENHGTIENCSVSGSVSGTYGVGGIVGDNTGTIKACYNTGNVSGTEIGNSIGGIVGYNEGTIENCSISGSVLGICKVGGIAGCNGGTISGCNNKGKVSGTEAEFVGGIAGYSYEKITACYNTGEVSGHKEVGGIVGYNENGKKNSACYNTGNVLGFINIGGIAGDNYGTITACYWSVPEGSSITGIGYGSCSTTQVGENSVTWKAATSAMNDAISDWNIENSSKCDYQFVQKDGESEPPVLEKGAPATT